MHGACRWIDYLKVEKEKRKQPAGTKILHE